jgi:hypothetical protein
MAIDICSERFLSQLIYDFIYFRKGIFLRNDHDDSTASRLLSEVKHRRARLVLRWGTTLESRVLFFFCRIFSIVLDSSLLFYPFAGRQR